MITALGDARLAGASEGLLHDIQEQAIALGATTGGCLDAGTDAASLQDAITRLEQEGCLFLTIGVQLLDLACPFARYHCQPLHE
ncbi:hypothetical protein Q3H58_001133 [Pseudomonas psychrotolerans]|nr:hypothetical protein [Pseudomonas psychrotolerans]